MVDLPPRTMAESARLHVLQAYRSLSDDTHLQGLAGVATQLCDTPISLINLVGEDHLWSITAVGIEPIKIPKKNALCEYAISSDSELVIPDTLEDARFAEHPLVVNEPKVRFYAALPIIVQGGFRIGTFCVVDGTPRTPTREMIDNLRVLRDAASTHLEYKQAQASGLNALIMLCAWCDKVKIADQTEWLPIKDYLGEHSKLSHGICPSCLSKQASGSEAEID